MSAGIESNIWDAIRVLCLALLIAFIYKQAKAAGDKNGRFIAMRDGVLICLGVASLTAISLGQPSCADRDESGCSEYNDDGYTPTHDAQIGTFLFWAILLNTPLMFGIMDSRKFQPNPWKRPVEIKRLEEHDLIDR